MSQILKIIHHIIPYQSPKKWMKNQWLNKCLHDLEINSLIVQRCCRPPADPRLQYRQTHLLGRDIYLPIVQLLVLFLLYCCNSCCSGGRRCGSSSSNSSGSSLSKVWGRPNAQTGTSTVSRVTAGDDGEISGQWIECTSVWGFVMSMSQSSGRQQPRGHMVMQNPAEIAWNKQLYKFTHFSNITMLFTWLAWNRLLGTQMLG